MTSVETAAHSSAAAPAARLVRRRRGWIAGAVVVALLAAVVAWQVAARSVTVERGGVSITSGVELPDCLPSEFWAMYYGNEDVVVAHTVRNPSPWTVTVTSPDPEVYRLEPASTESTSGWMFEEGADGGAPDDAGASVAIPPGGQTALWIVNPQSDAPTSGMVWRWWDSTTLTVRALGVEREVTVPLPGTLYVGGAADRDGIERALQQACAA